MVLTTEIEIKTTNKNISFYRNIYPDIKSGDVIKITPEQLPRTSKNKIEVECDNCHRELQILYHSYFRNVKDNKYYCNKCSSIRGSETSLKLYGYKHPLQNDDIKNKLKKTNLKKYGVEFPTQSDVIKNKIKNTCLEKYGETSYMKTKEFKNITINKNIESIGCEYPLQNEEIKKKWIKTNLEKYGSKYPLQSDIIKNKVIISKKLKYNDENYNNRSKFKKTCIEIFGYENPMQNLDIQDKLKRKMLSKYGVEHPSQNIDIFEKMLKSGYKINKFKNLYYQGEYELDFLNKYYDIGISRGESVKYIFNETEHIYFPDFYFKRLNLIIEIKSSKWYNEHKEKNIAKQKACQDQGYNFIFIIDKKYDIFNKIIKHIKYNKDHSWQYDIRIENKDNFIPDVRLKISDFEFSFIPDTDKEECNKIKNFIEKYEWLGKMPNRPTHRFIAKYKNEIAGSVILATPNTFSNLLGNDTKNLEKLISRGACASWTPKNLASSLIMWSIKWMIKNTQFRIFTAYSDPEAKELGTIYQACNFIYLGQKYGSTHVYFDVNKPHLNWFTSRYFNRKSSYKRFSKKLNLNSDWDKISEIPNDIRKILDENIEEYIKSCIKRKSSPKHKYVYILGTNKKETKHLINKFKLNNPKLLNLEYPKIR